MTYLTINVTRTVCDLWASLVSVGVTRHWSETTWVYLASGLHSILGGSQSRNLEARTEAEDPTWRHGGTLLHWTVPRSTLSYLSYTAKDYLPSDGTYCSGLDLLHQSSINKMPYRQAHRSIWWWHFPSWSCLGLCQLDKQNNQHRLYMLLTGETYSRPEDTSQCLKYVSCRSRYSTMMSVIPTSIYRWNTNLKKQQYFLK